MGKNPNRTRWNSRLSISTPWYLGDQHKPIGRSRRKRKRKRKQEKIGRSLLASAHDLGGTLLRALGFRSCVRFFWIRSILRLHIEVVSFRAGIDTDHLKSTDRRFSIAFPGSRRFSIFGRGRGRRWSTPRTSTTILKVRAREKRRGPLRNIKDR